jgi:hypothetical protein
MKNPTRKKTPEELAELVEVRVLRARKPQEWAQAVLNVPVEIRAQIARIVWWDFFAGREVANRWPHLDQYLKTMSIEHLRFATQQGFSREELNDIEFGRQLSKQEISDGLQAAGYPKMYAEARA